MGRWFDWLVEHERYVVGVTLVLTLALVAQISFCKRPEPPANQAPARTEVPAGTADVAGTWEMSVQKKRGGTQTWTLKLRQNGQQLKGVLTSEGGDLDVAGDVQGQNINLSAKKFGVTLELPAVLDGDTMKGEMHALSVRLLWTARRR